MRKHTSIQVIETETHGDMTTYSTTASAIFDKKLDRRILDALVDFVNDEDFVSELMDEGLKFEDIVKRLQAYELIFRTLRGDTAEEGQLSDMRSLRDLARKEDSRLLGNKKRGPNKN